MVFSLIDQISHCLPELSNSLRNFSDLLIKFHKFQQVKHEALIREMKKINPEDPDHEHKVKHIEETLNKIAEISEMLETEFKLKEKIIEELHKNSLNPAFAHKLTFFLTIWVSEPYLEERRLKDILETFQYIERVKQITDFS
jgi:hypothetical protein